MFTQSPWPRTYYSGPGNCYSHWIVLSFWDRFLYLLWILKTPSLSHCSPTVQSSLLLVLFLAEWAQRKQRFGRWSLRTSSATLDLEFEDIIPGGGNSNFSPITSFCKMQFIREKNDSLETLVLTCVWLQISITLFKGGASH